MGPSLPESFYQLLLNPSFRSPNTRPQAFPQFQDSCSPWLHFLLRPNQGWAVSGTGVSEAGMVAPPSTLRGGVQRQSRDERDRLISQGQFHTFFFCSFASCFFSSPENTLAFLPLVLHLPLPYLVTLSASSTFHSQCTEEGIHRVYAGALAPLTHPTHRNHILIDVRWEKRPSTWTLPHHSPG